MRYRAVCLVLSGLLLASATALIAAPDQRLAILDLVQGGTWQLHEIGSTAPARSICVRDPGLLLQIGHGTSPCTRVVVDNQARATTVHYSCPGAGNGRTTIRVESETLIRLQTQGIARGAPFDHDYEARRTGACR